MSTTVTSPPEHPALSALRVVDEALDLLADANLWSLSDDESLDVRTQLQRLTSRLAAATLRSTRDLDTRGAAVAVGATSLTSWLANVLHLHPGEAARQIRLSQRLSESLPSASAALSRGVITPAAAELIADTDRDLAAVATAGERDDADAFLAAQAELLGLRSLQATALHLRHRLDPERGRRLARDEELQVARRELRLADDADGSVRLCGRLDKEAGAFLRTALGSLAQPRPPDGASTRRRSQARRAADALVELVEIALRSGQLPRLAGQAAALVVAIDHDDLQRRVAAQGGSLLDTGVAMSAEAVRRLACDIGVLPAVLGSAGQPLDVGRAARTVPPSLRRLLDLRDGGCAFPGCDRPPSWCQAHHVQHWADGGETSCTNCVLLCGAHHRAVHHHGWRVRFGPDGLPDVVPPPWVDPDQRPRRNVRVGAVVGRPARGPTARVTPIRRT